MSADQSRPPRRSRVWLPSLLLLVVAGLWTIAWVVIRDRTVQGLDDWLAAEAADGKVWTCRDRTVGGYPFRIELGCGDFTYARGDATASLGRVGVVTQVYRPGHVIAEVSGPLNVGSDAVSVEGQWSLLQASLVHSGGAMQRFALAIDGSAFRVTPRDTPPVDVASDRFEFHLRPDPSVPGAVDAAASATGARVPALDALLGGSDPAVLDLVATVTNAKNLPTRPVPADLERWRVADGRVTVTRLALAKGGMRIEGQGALQLDDAHRPVGTLDMRAAGLEAAVGRLFGERAGLAVGLVGALLGGGNSGKGQARPGSVPDLKPLPTLVAERGRVRIGPLTLPGLRLDPLY